MVHGIGYLVAGEPEPYLAGEELEVEVHEAVQDTVNELVLLELHSFP